LSGHNGEQKGSAYKSVDVGLWIVKLEDLELPEHLLRESYSEEDIKRLAESIKISGLHQPLLVRRKPNGKYEIIDGCRRYHALKLLGKPTVEVKVVEATPEEAFMKGLEANMQRKSLNLIEQAKGFFKAWKELGYRVDVIAQRVGKTRDYILKMVKLLDLPVQIQSQVATSLLSPMVAYEFVRLGDKDLMLKVYNERKPEEWTAKTARARVNEVLENVKFGFGYQPPKPETREEGEGKGREDEKGDEETGKDFKRRPERCFICGDMAFPPDKTIIVVHKKCRDEMAKRLREAVGKPNGE
jgi:ParB/RepB/Spo0J family partition protein